MTNYICFALIGKSVLLLAGLGGAVVVTYLFLRANPKKRAAVDSAVDSIKKDL
jgi:hypothetical protein